MAPLPPVRKRSDYSDIKNTDLVAALFYDKLMPADAMQPSALARDLAAEAEAGTLKEASGRFAVFKDAHGADRWLSITTSAYQDKDGEWITTKAIRGAVDLADRTGFRGPLRFWHVPGLDLGQCDYQAITDNGRFLIESGTFNSPEAARIGLAAAAKGYQMSPGFVHPPSEPRNGEYHNIAIFERSFVPKGRASNPYTAFSATKERSMPQQLTEDKAKEFIGLSPDPESAKALLDSLLGDAERTDKEAQAAGKTFKSFDDRLGAIESSIAARDAKIDQLIAKVESALVYEEKDDGEGDMEVAAEGDTADSAAPQYVGDMTPEDFTAMIVAAVKAAIGGADAPPKAEEPPAAEATQKDDSAAQQRQQLEQQLSDISKRLKELEGDQPSAGYRASAASDNIVTKEAAEAQTPVIDQFVKQWFPTVAD